MAIAPDLSRCDDSSEDDYVRTLDAWLSDPIKSYELWARTHRVPTTGKRVKESTVKVKKAMWGKFCRWMNDQDIDLSNCTELQIEGFFEDESVGKEQRQRYIQLIEHVYVELHSLGLLMKNPGQEAAFDGLGAGRNERMRFFAPEERVEIHKAWRRECAPYVKGIERIESLSEQNWARVRDLAMVGLIWGGGVRVMEVCQMSVNCTYDGESLVVEATGEIPEHRTDLLEIGIESLNMWLPLRKSLKGHGDRMFPPDKEMARRNLHGKLSGQLHPSNVYRRVRAMLAEFGINGRRTAPQTLRNTYAAMRIEQGWDDECIRAALGLKEDRAVPRIRAQHKVWSVGQHVRE